MNASKFTYVTIIILVVFLTLCVVINYAFCCYISKNPLMPVKWPHIYLKADSGPECHISESLTKRKSLVRRQCRISWHINESFLIVVRLSLHWCTLNSTDSYQSLQSALQKEFPSDNKRPSKKLNAVRKLTGGKEIH